MTIGGLPAAGGKVAFTPVAKSDGMEGGKAAVGLIQPDGRFVLTTYDDGDGAIVGEHWAMVFVPDRTSAPVDIGEGGTIPSPTYKRRTVPKKQLVIAGQENEINIAL